MFPKELLLNVPETLTVPSCPPETVVISFPKDLEESTDHPQRSAPLPFGENSHIYSASLKDGRQLSTSGTRPIFEFWLEAPEARHRPGDSIGIFPRNSKLVVDQLIAHQGWESQADVPFEITFLPGSKKAKTLQYIPTRGSTLRRVLSDCIDLEKPPSKLFLLSIIKYCPTEDAVKTVRLLCAKEMMTVYAKEVMENRVSVADFVIGMDIQIPFSVLLENTQRLLPRPYSIINSPSKTSGIRIAFSWDSELPGLTTTMLRSYIGEESTRDPIYFYFRKPTSFRLDENDIEKNLILIGPGLGVVPYIGMLEEVEARPVVAEKLRLIFTSWRNQGVDDVFRNELLSFKSPKLHFAYTRDNNKNQPPKHYVQDMIISMKEEVAPLLDDACPSKVFICGESKVMIPQIEKSLVQCLMEELKITEGDAQKKIKELKEQQKIVIEQWF